MGKLAYVVGFLDALQGMVSSNATLDDAFSLCKQMFAEVEQDPAKKIEEDRSETGAERAL